MRVLMRRIAVLLIVALIGAQPAYAQSILRDAETEAYFADITRPLILSAGLSPNTVKVYLINDDEINAFTAGGQTIYVNSGLLAVADNTNQLQGVIAHELGHVADGHVINASAGAKPALGIQLLSMVVGLAAMAAGGGEAGAGILAAGQQAAMGRYLSFARTTEATADATGAKFLRESGISGRGMLEFFKKLQNEEYRYGYSRANIDPYAQTHPMSADRIATLTADLQASPAWNAQTPAALDVRFHRIRAKLKGFVQDPRRTLTEFPEDDQSIDAHYARAFAWHKAAYPEKAEAECAALLRAEPDDPYFLELQGQVLLESGEPAKAIPPLRRAVALTNNQPLIATTFGHALIATENKANYPEALKTLRAAVSRDDQDPFAWFELGSAYSAMGDEAHAALASAEQASINNQNGEAAFHAKAALAGLTPGTPDYLRAQDIALSSGNAMDRRKKKH